MAKLRGFKKGGIISGKMNLTRGESVIPTWNYTKYFKNLLNELKIYRQFTYKSQTFTYYLN